MSEINSVLVQNCQAEYSQNVVGRASYLNRPISINFVGGGTTTGTAIQVYDKVYEGGAIKVEITNLDTGHLPTISSPDEGFTAPYSGLYRFSHRIADTSTDLQQSGVFYYIQVFKNGVYFNDIKVVAGDGYKYRGKWNTFSANIGFNAGDVVTWKIIINGIDLLSSPILYFSGFCVNFDDGRALGFCPIYRKPKELEPEFPTTDGDYQVTITDGVPTFQTL